jgi:DNA-binding NtrC family response regulator
MIQPLNILLLEDRDSDAMLIEQQLKNSEIDFRFHRATNRAEYMEAIGSFNPDIILSDENLPAYNGLLAYKDMKETGKMLPFIIITGSLSDELTSQIITAGIDDYLLKDRLSRLPKAITNALEKKQAELERENYINELQEAQRNLLKAN